MEWPSKCPICGGELVERKTHKVIEGGNNTGVLEVIAAVCLKCGERLYAPETIKHFEEIRERLKKNAVEGFKPIGKTYSVA